MGRAVVADHPGGVEAVEVGAALAQRYQAVGGQQHRAVERLELVRLMPPRPAVIADEMGIFLERRVGVGRQHLAVGIDIDPGALGLVQQFLQVLEVMAADQDAGVGPHPDIDLGDLGMAVGRRIGLVEQGHGGHRGPPGLHHQGEHLVDRQFLRRRGQGLEHEVADLILAVTEDHGVLGIGGDPLETDDQHLLQRAHILVGGAQHPDCPGLGGEVGGGAAPGRLVGQRIAEILAVFRLVGSEKGRPQAVASPEPVLDHRHEAAVGPVGVGDGGEQPLEDELVVAAVGLAELSQPVAVDRHAAQDEEQHVLQVGGRLRLAADPLDRTAAVLGRFLALKAKHRRPPLVNFRI